MALYLIYFVIGFFQEFMHACYLVAMVRHQRLRYSLITFTITMLNMLVLTHIITHSLQHASVLESVGLITFLAAGRAIGGFRGMGNTENDVE